MIDKVSKDTFEEALNRLNNLVTFIEKLRNLRRIFPGAEFTHVDAGTPKQMAIFTYAPLNYSIMIYCDQPDLVKVQHSFMGVREFRCPFDPEIWDNATSLFDLLHRHTMKLA